MKNFSPQIDINFSWELRRLSDRFEWGKEPKIVLDPTENKITIYRDYFTKEFGGLIPRSEWEKNFSLCDEYLHEVLKMVYLKVVSSSPGQTRSGNFFFEPQFFYYTWEGTPVLHTRVLNIHRDLFKNKVFVITGKLKWWTRKEYEDIIIYLGGKVEKKINHKVTHLIEGDLSSKGGDSIKIKNAKEYGTSIISENDFRKLI